MTIEIGVIGGSGLYEMPGLEVTEERAIETPFGEPSEKFVLGQLGGRSLAFLTRHGRGHRILPSELNFRANLWAFKSLGVERIVSLSAVGSLKEVYAPTHVVIPDQFIDRTRHRVDTFFGRGIAAHVGFGDPICQGVAETAFSACEQEGAHTHRGGTYVCMEGPQFSTRAESELYRSWGADVIGMTNLQEAKLAREAEICYATIALVTDYDCWHTGEEDVTVDAVLETLAKNVALAQRVVARVVSDLPRQGDCPCGKALEGAIMTSPDAIPEATARELRPLLRRHLEGGS